MWRGRLSPSSHPRRPAPPFFNHGVASRHSLPGEDAALIVFPKQQCGQMCCFPTGRRSTGAGFRRVRLVRCTTLFGLAEISCGLSCSVFTKVVGHWLRRVRSASHLARCPSASAIAPDQLSAGAPLRPRCSARTPLTSLARGRLGDENRGAGRSQFRAPRRLANVPG
jgi:hypothetical protein